MRSDINFLQKVVLLLQHTKASFHFSIHCVKSVPNRSYSGPYFPAFGLNKERYRVSLRIQSECGKIRTRITLNTDTFYELISLENKKNPHKTVLIY